MAKRRSITKIRLGICMAGAVSAGAYTAGVLDYLIEALERWEKLKTEERNRKGKKKKAKYQIPMHDLEIVVLAGSSAGGMTAALAARALQEEIRPITTDRWDECRQALSDNMSLANPLYESWVKLSGNDPVKQMLDTADLNSGGNKIPSLLNSGFLDTIAENILVRSLSAPPPKRPYIAGDLEVLMTLSNLGGVPTRVPFRSSTEGKTGASFAAKQHRDFVHFVVGENSGLEKKGRIPINFSDQKNLGLFSSAALATGAFPIMLKPRSVSRPVESMEKNPILHNLLGEHFSTFSKESCSEPDGIYSSLNVDGGMLNNEPFDIVDQVMQERSTKNDDNILNILLMIDPFPSEEEKEEPQSDKSDVISVLQGLISVFRQQNMVKPDYMRKEKGGEDYRFIMIPSKDSKNGADINGSRALASGALEGFSGFLHESFRHHDFILGRINCKNFLQKYFVIPRNSVSGVGLPPNLGTNNRKDKATGDDNMVVVIPDLDLETREFKKIESCEKCYTDYPSYDIANLETYKAGFLARFKAILRIAIKLSWLRILIFKYLKERAWTLGKGMIEKELREWGLVRED